MVKSRRIVLLFDERAKEIPPQTIRVDGHFFNRYAKKGKPHDGE